MRLTQPGHPARRRRRGANAVEFALTLPILIFILSGVVDFSWYLHRQFVLINSVSQGARAAATTEQGATPTPETVATSVAHDSWTASGLSSYPTFTAQRTGNGPDEIITVTGFQAFTPLVGILPVPAEIRYAAVMRMDDQPPPPPP